MLLSADTVVVDENTVLEDAGLLVENGDITTIEDAEKLREQYPDQKHLTCDILTPGFVQTHVHSVQSPGRGLADDTELFEWLYDHILPIEAQMTADELELAAKLSYVELLENGTTCLVDHLTVNHSERAFQAAGKTGIRGVLGKVLMDRNSPEGLLEETERGLEESRRLIDRYHRSYDDRIRYAITPRFTPTCSESCLRGTRALADEYEGVQIHTHASEHESVLSKVKEVHGMRDIHWLHEVGLTGEDVLLAHVIFTDESERQLLAETGTNVTYCPSANMKVGAGVAPIVDYLDRGINVSLGNDGPPANNTLDPLTEMRLATLLQTVEHRDPRTLPAETVFRMATRAGTRASGFNRLGALREGWGADIVGISIDNSRAVPFYDVYSYLVYAARGGDVSFVVVDGDLVVEDGDVTTVDGDDIRRRARETFENRTWETSSSEIS